ncbi:MAG: L-histidine N(alpha)-methyltransferase, partial [Burkholderiales bacterium]
SKEHLLRSTSALARDYSNLTVVAVCADYLRPLPLPVTSPCVGTRVGFFPGSTLGNFSPREAIQFLRTARQHLGPGGKLLLGVDLKKDPRLLHAAYNDTEGVTAAFNLNVLARINCECGADFDVDGFRHRAFYNEPLGRVEMHLRSTRAQTVHIDGTPIEFTEGETIHTENCYKYTYAECERLAVCCGFELTRYWTDKNDWFGVFMLRRES